MKAEHRLTQEQKDVIQALLFTQEATFKTQVLLRARKFQSPSEETDNISHAEECLSAHVLSRLQDVKKTLKNIDSKDFGICEICNEPIPFDRLMAMPTVMHCVRCAMDNDHHSPVPKKIFRSLILIF
jgi:RNA polymerase-binding transcription factor DksA